MYYNITPVLDRTDQIRSSERIVDDQGYLVAMGNISDYLYIYNIGIRISQGFNKDSLCIRLNGFLEIRQVSRIDKGGGYPISGQCMRQQIITTAINGFSSNDMVTGTGNILKCIGNSSSTGGYSQPCYTTFQDSYPLFKNTLSRISQASVYVTRILQTETGCGMCRVMKHIRCCLINRNCT